MYVCMYNKSTNRQYSTQYRTNVVYYSLLRQRLSLRGRTCSQRRQCCVKCALLVSVASNLQRLLNALARSLAVYSFVFMVVVYSSSVMGASSEIAF